ncbi:MAG: prephenate dehydrogenase [Chloroflexota bacterium]
MKALDEAEFTIVGTGLMGSSLALSLRGKVKALRGVERDTAHRALAAPYFDEIVADLDHASASADVIILATPIRVIVSLLDRLKTLAKPGTLILDLGSSKTQIVRAMDTLPETLLAIGGHPMGGKETSGPTEADATLFVDRVFVLCPSQRSTPEALTFAQSMIDAIGARCLILPAERHDRAVASISHMPHVISVGLVRAVMEESQADDTPWLLASSGFRDMSRLAGSDLTMLGDMLLTNRQAVLDTLVLFRKQIDQIEAALQTSDEAELRAILESAQHARSDWYERWRNSSE